MILCIFANSRLLDVAKGLEKSLTFKGEKAMPIMILVFKIEPCCIFILYPISLSFHEKILEQSHSSQFTLERAPIVIHYAPPNGSNAQQNKREAKKAAMFE